MKRLVCTLALALMAASALAQVRVEEPWVRATVPGQKVTGAFMQLNSAQDVKLVGVRSPIAARAEMHEMAMEGEVMKMRQVPSIAVPAGKPVSLASGSLHVMLFDLKKPVKVGDTVPLTLELEGKDGKRQTVEVQAPVRPLGGQMQMHQHQHQH